MNMQSNMTHHSKNICCNIFHYSNIEFFMFLFSKETFQLKYYLIFFFISCLSIFYIETSIFRKKTLNKIIIITFQNLCAHILFHLFQVLNQRKKGKKAFSSVDKKYANKACPIFFTKLLSINIFPLLWMYFRSVIKISSHAKLRKIIFFFILIFFFKNFIFYSPKSGFPFHWLYNKI